MFTKQYPNESILPILHYMVHYPQQIISHGPLVRAWTKRFERKLKYFKEIAQLGNFKNVTLTLAKRHQCWLAYYIHSGNLFTFELTRGPILSSSTPKEAHESIRQVIWQHIPHVSSDETCTSLRWVTVNGIKYSCENCFLMTDIEVDGTPKFGQIESIVSLFDLSEVYFIISYCKVITYNPHLLAYEVEFTNNPSLLSSKYLHYYEVLHKRKLFFHNWLPLPLHSSDLTLIIVHCQLQVD